MYKELGSSAVGMVHAQGAWTERGDGSGETAFHLRRRNGDLQLATSIYSIYNISLRSPFSSPWTPSVTSRQLTNIKQMH